MRLKKATKRLATAGTIDFAAGAETIKLHLAEMAQHEIAKAVGMTPMVMSQWFVGCRCFE